MCSYFIYSFDYIIKFWKKEGRCKEIDQKRENKSLQLLQLLLIGKNHWDSARSLIDCLSEIREEKA